MQRLHILTFISFLFLGIGTTQINAQAIRGTVIDGANGETLPFATVQLVEDASIGVTTDLDGNFSLENLSPGTYSININYMGYETKRIDNIILVEGQIEVLGAIQLGEDALVIETVEVIAKSLRNTDNAVQTLKRKSVQSIDGVSSQTFSITGDGDAAAAMKRVTGVSVEGGKYVYVRGLGDRYSKTYLNGAEIPGLDPDRNTVQMDLFPTNLIDNLLVYKTFTPDLPGSFTGGLVDIVTKDFPEALTFKASVSLGYNPNVHFNNNYLSYQGGGTDWLATDDGTRDIPQYVLDNGIPINRYFDLNATSEATSSFNNIMDTVKTSVPLDHSVSLALGNQTKLFGKTFGFIASANYSRAYNFYDQGITGRWKLTEDVSTATGLNQERFLDDSMGSDEVLMGGMLSGTLKLNNANKIGLNIFVNQTARSSARFQDGVDPQNGGDVNYQERTLAYQERFLNTYQLQGKHNIGQDKLELDWIGSFSISQMEEPDIRFLQNIYFIEPDNSITYVYAPDIHRTPTRYWRALDEKTLDVKFNAKYKFRQWSDLQANLKVGAAFFTKNRDFSENFYEFDTDIPDFFNGNFVDYVADENIFSVENTDGVFILDKTQQSNQYNASMNIGGAYAMTELPLTNSIKMVTGARLEITQINFTGFSRRTQQDLNNITLLDDVDLLPSLGFIFEPVKDKMNVRLSYNRTLARPTFKEIAPANFVEVKYNTVLLGNDTLKRATIDNVDLRWEYFFQPGELISFSGFYKNFNDPIEITNNPQAPNGEWTYRNIDRGQVFGLEFEARKKLDFVNALRNFTLGTNLTLTRSVVSIQGLELISIRGLDPNADDTRPMFGQSPYIINAFLNYTNQETGTNASLNFNVQGERLALISLGSTPNVFENPAPQLNFKISQNIVKVLNVSFTATNMLNAENLMVQEFKDQEFVFQSFRPGPRFAVGLSYNLSRAN